MLQKKMKKISQIVKSVWFKADFSLVPGSHQRCDPGSVRFFSIFFSLRERLNASDFCNNGVYGVLIFLFDTGVYALAGSIFFLFDAPSF